MKINLDNKIELFRAISQKNNQVQPVIKLKSGVRLSNDNLSKSIRNKKDAENFINELKSAFKKAEK